MNCELKRRPIHKAIAEYIRENGICQAALAKECGWSRGRLQAILSGRNRLYAEDMVKICDVLSLPCDYFIERRE